MKDILLSAVRSMRSQLLHQSGADRLAWSMVMCVIGPPLPAHMVLAKGSCGTHLLSLALWYLMMQLLMYFLVGCHSNEEIGSWKPTAPACLCQPTCLEGWREAGHRVWQMRTGRWPHLWGHGILCMRGSEPCCSQTHWPLIPNLQVGLNLMYLHLRADA